MFDLGPHATFIWATYGAAAMVIGGLITWVILDGRALRETLARLESEGRRRRPVAKPENGN